MALIRHRRRLGGVRLAAADRCSTASICAIEEGEFVCVLGQTGCGKSTLLRLMLGSEKPHARPHPGRWRGASSARSHARLRAAEVFAVPRQDRARQHHLRPGGRASSACSAA